MTVAPTDIFLMRLADRLALAKRHQPWHKSHTEELCSCGVDSAAKGSLLFTANRREF
jgi:hypothetical protein